jgi:hypothetical protein
MLIIQLDSEQLSSLIQSAVRKVISESPKLAPLPPAPDLLSVIETADLLKVSVPTIYGYSHRKILAKKSIKGCRRIFFSRGEVMKMLDAGRTKSNSELEQLANDYVYLKK